MTTFWLFPSKKFSFVTTRALFWDKIGFQHLNLCRCRNGQSKICKKWTRIWDVKVKRDCFSTLWVVNVKNVERLKNGFETRWNSTHSLSSREFTSRSSEVVFHFPSHLSQGCYEWIKAARENYSFIIIYNLTQQNQVARENYQLRLRIYFLEVFNFSLK